MGLIKALSGLIRALESLGLFYLKVYLGSLLADLMDDRLITASKAWPLYTKQPYPQTEVIFLNELVDLLDVEILELYKRDNV